MEPEKDDLEDDFPFQLGDLLVPMLIFHGVVYVPRTPLQQATRDHPRSGFSLCFSWLI